MKQILSNLVVGSDGSTTLGGSSRGLSSQEDRHRFHRLRERADAILIGGNTARNEPYAKTPVPLFVLTHGELPHEVAENSKATTILGNVESFIEKFEGVLLLEAGPSLLKEALRKKLIDTFYLTIASASPAENQISISELTSGYQEIDHEELNGEVFTTFIPMR